MRSRGGYNQEEREDVDCWRFSFCVRIPYPPFSAADAVVWLLAPPWSVPPATVVFFFVLQFPFSSFFFWLSLWHLLIERHNGEREEDEN